MFKFNLEFWKIFLSPPQRMRYVAHAQLHVANPCLNSEETQGFFLIYPRHYLK